MPSLLETFEVQTTATRVRHLFIIYTVGVTRSVPGTDMTLLPHASAKTFSWLAMFEAEVELCPSTTKECLLLALMPVGRRSARIATLEYCAEDWRWNIPSSQLFGTLLRPIILDIVGLERASASEPEHQPRVIWRYMDPPTCDDVPFLRISLGLLTAPWGDIPTVVLRGTERVFPCHKVYQDWREHENTR